MNQDCPITQELLDEESRALEHARNCERCRALLSLGAAAQEEVAVPPLPGFTRAALPDRTPLAVRVPGEVVTLRGEDPEEELLLAAVLAVSEDSLEVAPLSGEVGSASEWDLIVGAGDGPLGYGAIAEVWNHGRVSLDDVAESFGALSEERSAQLLALYAEVFAGESPEGVPTGAPILTERDPRTLFQEREAGRAQTFWIYAEDVGGEIGEGAAAGIGTYVNAWMEEVGTDATDLATDAGWMKVNLERLLREEVDPLQGAFAPDPMGVLLALTSIDAEEVDARLHVTLAPQIQTAASAPVTALRPVFHRASAETERKLAGRSSGALEAYITAVIEALEEHRG